MMLDKKIAIGIGALLLLSSMIMLSGNASATTFTLKSWEVADDDGYPSLLIKFDVTDSVELIMLDPDGVQVDWDYVDEIEHGVYMHLAGYKDTPQSGTYTFNVKTSWPEETIYTKEFTFGGPDLSIKNVQTDWKYSSGDYDCEWIKITVNNSGDLPIYPYKGITQIGSEDETSYFFDAVVMPNKQEILEDTSPYISLPHGTYSITVTLEDYDENLIASYSDSVTIQSTVNFNLKSWEVRDDGGYPSLYVNFDVNEDCKIKLIHPDGTVADYDYVEADEHGTYLHMAGYYEAPNAGNYKIKVTLGYSDNEIFSKSFTFDGSDLSITDVETNWNWSKLLETYMNEWIDITVKNNGDLPIYPDGGTVKVGGEEGTLTFLTSPAIMPNHEYTIHEKLLFFTVPSGSHSIHVTLTDTDDNVIVTYNGTVAIGEEHGHGEEETPGFELAFLIIAIASMILIKRRNKKNR